MTTALKEESQKIEKKVRTEMTNDGFSRFLNGYRIYNAKVSTEAICFELGNAFGDEVFYSVSINPCRKKKGAALTVIIDKIRK